MTNEKRAEYLRSAQARLICRVEGEGGGPVDEDGRVKLTTYVRKVEHGPDEVISEGYDPDNSPLGCPVYWRIISRGDDRLYCSTFLAKPHEKTQYIYECHYHEDINGNIRSRPASRTHCCDCTRNRYKGNWHKQEPP